jgi:hypothetical protein
MLYAERKGELKDLEFEVLCTKPEGQGLVYERVQARVVSQLRYEYALNLVQRLGTTFTRIGLDFVG